MSDVIGLRDFLDNRLLTTSRGASARPRHQHCSFTPRDHADLEEWSTADRRVSTCMSDLGPFAMLYQAGKPWASWGVVRQGRSVLLWDCVTLADIGRFPSMMDALAAVPIDDFLPTVANVIPFASARGRDAPLS